MGHNGHKSLCGFCEEQMLGELEAPTDASALELNTPKANRFRVMMAGYAGRSNSLGRKAKTF